LKKNKICYIGGISEIRGIIPLIDAMAQCNNITLDLAGEFPDGPLKTKAKASLGWQFVNELGFINREKAQQIKSESIAGVVSFFPAENHINAQPNKIFEYMASGLPVIGSDFPLWRDIIEKNNCGVCVDPYSPQSIADAVIQIASDKQKALLMGKNGIDALKQKYNWNSEKKKLLALYTKLLKQIGNE
jgi:glycosyltransferase involved in cell wall biosynthesis